MRKCFDCEEANCVCCDCNINPCFYKDSDNCFSDYCIKEDEEKGTFMGYDVDDPDDLEDCFEDLTEF